MSSQLWHPDESQLLGFADAELEHAEAGKIEEHIGECETCRHRVRDIQAFWKEYRHTRRAVLPPPPAAWPSLASRLDELDAGRVRNQRQPSRSLLYRGLAAAAAIFAGAVIFQLSQSRTLNAAELLRNAIRAEQGRQTSAKPQRVRVKTRRTQYVRTAGARVAAAEEARLSALFKEASFNWDEPLSPRAFASWRDGLAHRDDDVKVMNDTEWGSGRFYRIATATPDGPLSEATITIRASDLQAVQQTFTFGTAQEYVEITEASGGEPAVTSPALPAGTPSTPAITEPARAHTITPADELRVVSVIHSIGADLGDPVEITADHENGRIVVSALAADATRQTQLRSALAGVPYVDLKFEQPEAVRQSTAPPVRRAPAQSSASNTLQDRLAERLGGRETAENFINHVLDLSDSALARAHALRALAKRFPKDTESQLDSADAATLRRIEEDHTKALLSAARQLREVVRSVTKEDLRALPPAITTWQSGIDSLLESARQLDQLMTSSLDSAGDPGEVLRRVNRSAADLEARAAALHDTVARAR